jgi:hypothetical protein
LVDRDDLAVGVGRRCCGDARALAGGTDAGFGERETGPGPMSLAGEDRCDLVVGVVLGEAAISSTVSSGSRRRSGPRALSRTLSSVLAPPSQQISMAARRSAA